MTKENFDEQKKMELKKKSAEGGSDGKVVLGCTRSCPQMTQYLSSCARQQLEIVTVGR